MVGRVGVVRSIECRLGAYTSIFLSFRINTDEGFRATKTKKDLNEVLRSVFRFSHDEPSLMYV